MHVTHIVPVTGPHACLNCGARYELHNAKNLHCRLLACARAGGRLVPFDERFFDRFAAAHQNASKSDDERSGRVGRRARRRVRGGQTVREVVYRRGKAEAFMGSIPLEDTEDVGIDPKAGVVVVTDDEGEEVTHRIPRGCKAFLRDSSDEQELEEVEASEDDDEDGEDDGEDDGAGEDED
jgi:hypothetical protein